MGVIALKYFTAKYLDDDLGLEEKDVCTQAASQENVKNETGNLEEADNGDRQSE